MPLSNLPQWLQTIQEGARLQLEKVGMPNTKDETWRYTPSNKLLQKFSASETTHAGSFVLPQEFTTLLQTADAALVFYNGIFLQNISKELNRPDEHVQRMAQVLPSAGRLGELAKKSFERNPNVNLKGLGYENIIGFNDGAFIYVGPKAKQNQKILLLNIYGNQLQAKSQTPFSCHTRHVLHFAQSVRAQVIEAHIAVNEIQFRVGHTTQCHLDDEAEIELTQLWWLGEEAQFVSDNLISQQSKSNLKMAQVIKGSEVGRLELLVELNGKQAELNLHSLNLGIGNTHTDYSSSIRHVVGETLSRQVARGVYDDSSTGVFSGHLSIEKDAQKSDAAQLTRNVLIGEDAQAFAKPQLEVFADDVKAAHGATVGQLREDEIFYLMSRGIPRHQAIQILSAGIQRDVLRTQGEWVRSQILPFLSPDFGQEAESAI